MKSVNIIIPYQRDCLQRAYENGDLKVLEFKNKDLWALQSWVENFEKDNEQHLKALENRTIKLYVEDFDSQHFTTNHVSLY